MRKILLLAIFVAGVDLLAVTACGLLYYLNRISVLTYLNTVAFSLAPLCGAVIIARQPRNPVGWLIAAIGFTFTAGDLVAQYAQFALVTHPGLPLGGVAVWLASWSWMLVLPLVTPFLLFLPNGQLLSRRWAVLIWAAALTSLPMILWMLVYTAFMDKMVLLSSQNGGPQGTFGGGLQIWNVLRIWQVFQLLLILLAVISLFVRYRRSRGVERQQLKWIFLSITTIPIAVLSGILTGFVNTPLVNALNQVTNIVSGFAFPVALVIAVTRYRLYDIDFILRRTLVYSILTLTLALVYFAVVTLLQMAFESVSGQQSAVAVVASTLLIAALFSPLRRRLQTWIDRRFFRPRYDTGQILAKLVARERELINIDQYGQELIALVDAALHPEFVSLYLVNPPEMQPASPARPDQPHKILAINSPQASQGSKTIS